MPGMAKQASFAPASEQFAIAKRGPSDQPAYGDPGVADAGAQPTNQPREHMDKPKAVSIMLVDGTEIFCTVATLEDGSLALKPLPGEPLSRLIELAAYQKPSPIPTLSQGPEARFGPYRLGEVRD